LNGKYIALYFSASWCGPCQRVTPLLTSQVYPKFMSDGLDLEFVLMPYCKTENKFNEYFAKMPWPSVPYAERAAIDQRIPVSVDGYPTIVIIDPQGNTITKKGLQEMIEDPAGFPWAPLQWADFFPGNTFVKNDGTQITSAELTASGKTIFVYFSAHWCPPCRGFTPKLAEFYNRFSEEKDFEVIFVSKDKNQAQFDEYFATHPWFTVPYENEALRKQFAKCLPHKGIPTLAMLNSDGSVQRMNARMSLMMDMEGVDYPWAVDTMIDPRSASEMFTLLLFQQDETPEKRAEREGWLVQPSIDARSKGEDQDWNYISVRTVEDGSVADQILEKCEETPESGRCMVLLALFRGGFYYVGDLPETEDDLNAFIQGFKDGTLQRHRMI